MKKILNLLLATTLLVSCASEDVATSSNVLKVNVNEHSMEQTKLITDQTAMRTNGQKVEIFLKGTGYTSALSEWTLTAGSWAVGTAVNLSGLDASVYAYVPSSLTADLSTYLAPLTATSVPQTTQLLSSDTYQADFLYQPEVVSPAIARVVVSNRSSTAYLTLSHAMAKFTFIVNLGTGYPASTAPTFANIKLDASSAIFSTTTGAVFTPVASCASYNVATGAFTNMAKVSSLTFPASGGSANTNLLANANAVSYSVLVAPVTPGTAIADKVVDVVLTIDGKQLTAELGAFATGIQAGKEYKVTLTLLPTPMTITSTVSVTDWTSGGTYTNDIK